MASKDTGKPGAKARQRTPAASRTAPAKSVTKKSQKVTAQGLKDANAVKAIIEAGGNISEAARRLGRSREALGRRAAQISEQLTIEGIAQDLLPDAKAALIDAFHPSQDIQIRLSATKILSQILKPANNGGVNISAQQMMIAWATDANTEAGK